MAEGAVKPEARISDMTYSGKPASSKVVIGRGTFWPWIYDKVSKLFIA